MPRSRRMLGILVGAVVEARLLAFRNSCAKVLALFIGEALVLLAHRVVGLRQHGFMGRPMGGDWCDRGRVQHC